jgi:hypothetical protein
MNFTDIKSYNYDIKLSEAEVLNRIMSKTITPSKWKNPEAVFEGEFVNNHFTISLLDTSSVFKKKLFKPVFKCNTEWDEEYTRLFIKTDLPKSLYAIMSVLIAVIIISFVLSFFRIEFLLLSLLCVVFAVLFFIKLIKSIQNKLGYFKMIIENLFPAEILD